MQRILVSFILLFAIVVQGISQELKSKSDSLSYALGLLISKNVEKQAIPSFNLEVFQKAVEDYFEKNELSLSIQKANQLMKEYGKEKAEADKIIAEKRALENKLAGITFLEENASRMNVVTLPSGLQYEVITEGEGEMPPEGAKVTCHYVGTLIDGTVFDSSVERGEPLSFPLSKVIKAWQEALPMMKVGSKWKLYAPYQLAYGERTAGPVIKPFSALIFEVELLDFILQ